MKLLSIVLSFVLPSCSVDAKSIAGASAVAKPNLAPMGLAFKAPWFHAVYSDSRRSTLLFEHLLEPIPVGEGEEPRIRLEEYYDQGGLLFQVLKQERFGLEDFEPERFKKRVGRFWEILDKAEKEAGRRFETIQFEVSRRLDSRFGETALAQLRIYELSDMAQSLHRDRFLLDKEDREELGELRLQIQDAREIFEGRVRRFHEDLKETVLFEREHPISETPILWTPLGGRASMRRLEGVEMGEGGAWLSDDLGPEAEFGSREEALRDRIRRLQKAPPGPWLVPLVDSTRLYLERKRSQLSPNFVEAGLAKLKQIEEGLERDLRGDSPPLVEAVARFRDAEKRGLSPSLDTLESLISEVARLNHPILEKGEEGQEVDISPGIRYRIDEVLRRGGRLPGFPQGIELAPHAKRVADSWKWSIFFHNVFILLSPVPLLIGIVYFDTHSPTLLVTLASLGLVFSPFIYAVYYGSSFIPRWEKVEKIEAFLSIKIGRD